MISDAPLTPGGLETLDWIVLAAYLMAMVALGASFYKGQKTTRDFFLAGRSMNWFPVGLSLIATLFSANSYMAIPSATQKYGLVLFVGPFVIFLCIPIVNRIFLPFYNQMQLYSAYEYLEHRFDVRVRCLASGLFIVWRITWMAAALYSASLALWAATGGNINLYGTIISLGLFATFYTVLGGMKAVIWTDVIQFCVLFGGMIVAATWATSEVTGGIATLFQTMADAGKTSFVANIPEMEAATGLWAKLMAYFCVQDQMTLIGVIVSHLIAYVTFFTVDQATVQRYFTTRSVEAGRRAFWVTAIGDTAISLCLTTLGMALFAYYSSHPLPEQIAGVEFQSDWKYPYFIATVLPAGVAGLLVAALYAATMSSLDSGINSCSTAFLVDFWQRLKHGQVRPVEEEASPGDSQSHQLFLARALTLVLGAVVTVLACFVGALGDIIVIGNKLVNSFAGPMFSIFLLGMLTRRARSMGVCVGAVAGMAVMAWLIFWTELNFLWPSAFGLVVSLSVGYGLSLFEREPKAEKLQWTLFEQRKLWREEG